MPRKKPDDRIIELDGFNRIVRGRDALYVVNANDAYVGRSLLLYGEYAPEEYDLLHQLTGPGAHVAEVGANTGAHTVRLAKRAELQGRVVAFEPQPVVFQALCATIALNSLLNVECWPYALAAEPGALRIPTLDYRKPGNYGSVRIRELPEGSIPVPVHRFDDVYAYDKLHLLKIDVEGMERDVLEGAAKTVEACRPVIYVENDQREKSPALIRWLMDAGYRLWWHAPPLYSPDNFFANAENVFGPVRSLNMVCVHESRDVNIPLNPVTGENDFPAIGAPDPAGG